MPKLTDTQLVLLANAANRNATVKTIDLFDVPWTPCR